MNEQKNLLESQAALTCILLLALLGVGTGWAGPLEDAREAYSAGDYTKTLQILEPLAREGDSEAQALLSVMYENGQGVTRDLARAVELLTQAAKSGSAFAQHDLGLRYYQGDSVEQSYKEAARWWELAAEAGIPDSQFNLGLIYFRGLGHSPDLERAKELFEKASQQGHDHALYSLGVMHAFGQGVETDYLQARLLFQRAANLGVPHAQYNLGVLYENGYGTKKDLGEARRWYRLAAAQALPEARARLVQLEGEAPVVADKLEPTPAPYTPQPPPQASPPVAAPPPVATAPRQTLSGAGRAQPPVVAPPPAAPSSSTPDDVVRRADWIRLQPDGYYTLQLVSVPNQVGVLEFVGRYSWAETIAYAQVRDKQGGTSYKAFYGIYSNSAAARGALSQLPAEVRKNKPWPRRFGDLKSILAE